MQDLLCLKVAESENLPTRELDILKKITITHYNNYNFCNTDPHPNQTIAQCPTLFPSKKPLSDN